MKKDETYLFKGQGIAIKVPHSFLPSVMHNRDCNVISISELVIWLADAAAKAGVEIYTGFAAKEIIVENGRVTGVRLGDKGLDKEKKTIVQLCKRGRNQG